MIATGIGPHPGSDARGYDEALRVVFAELGEPGGHGAARGLPYLPQLPGRGPAADPVGRTLAVVAELGADLQPAGWRLVGGSRSRSGIDHRRARSLLAQDLDAAEAHAHEWDGDFKVQVTGPWTLAARVERPRGDKVLADHGARRDLAEALAEGLREHVADVRRRLPRAARLVVQVDEPALADVLGAKVPTASGFGKHRAIDLPEASALLRVVLEAVTEADAEPWVRSAARGMPWGLVAGAGARGLMVEPAALGADGHEAVAEALESGRVVVLGVVPETGPAAVAPAERVLRWLDMVGLDPGEVADRLGVSPEVGQAGAAADAAGVARALGGAMAAARSLS